MEDPLTVTVLGTLHGLAWSVYVGGAIAMEFVLRYAQDAMRPSQVAVVCQKAGHRYRWISFLCLGVLLVTGLALVQPGSAVGTERVLLWTLGGVWFVLAAILALLSFYIHPELHIRVSPSMSEAEVTEERQRVKRAIVRMDIAVRAELVLAVCAMALGAGLHL